MKFFIGLISDIANYGDKEKLYIPFTCYTGFTVLHIYILINDIFFIVIETITSIALNSVKLQKHQIEELIK